MKSSPAVDTAPFGFPSVCSSAVGCALAALSSCWMDRSVLRLRLLIAPLRRRRADRGFRCCPRSNRRTATISIRLARCSASRWRRASASSRRRSSARARVFAPAAAWCAACRILMFMSMCRSPCCLRPGPPRPSVDCVAPLTLPACLFCRCRSRGCCCRRPSSASPRSSCRCSPAAIASRVAVAAATSAPAVPMHAVDSVDAPASSLLGGTLRRPCRGSCPPVLRPDPPERFPGRGAA